MPSSANENAKNVSIRNIYQDINTIYFSASNN